MSTPKGELCREAIRRTLIHRTENVSDACVVAEAAHHLLQQMVARLVPLIGDRGVYALLRRSLHLTGSFLPLLARTEPTESNATLLASLKADLAGREINAALGASSALLVTFTELLVTLIGESLAERLLSPVWGPLPPRSEQEIESCTTK